MGRDRCCRKYVPALTLFPEAGYSGTRRFRQAAGSRVTAARPAVAASSGLHASERPCNHCPVSHQIPVQNRHSQPSRRSGDFLSAPGKKTLKPSNFIEFYKNQPERIPPWQPPSPLANGPFLQQRPFPSATALSFPLPSPICHSERSEESAVLFHLNG
jgi:hypothetical protein